MNKNFSGIKCLLTPFRNRAQVTPGVCHLFFYYLHHHQLRHTVSWCGQLVTISAVIRAGRKDKGASHKLLVAFPTPAKVVYHQIRRFFFSSGCYCNTDSCISYDDIKRPHKCILLLNLKTLVSLSCPVKQ